MKKMSIPPTKFEFRLGPPPPKKKKKKKKKLGHV